MLRETEDYYLYADFTENPGNMCLGDVAASCSRSIPRVLDMQLHLSPNQHPRRLNLLCLFGTCAYTHVFTKQPLNLGTLRLRTLYERAPISAATGATSFLERPVRSAWRPVRTRIHPPARSSTFDGLRLGSLLLSLSNGGVSCWD